jgi:hypothetical protein
MWHLRFLSRPLIQIKSAPSPAREICRTHDEE